VTSTEPKNSHYFNWVWETDFGGVRIWKSHLSVSYPQRVPPRPQQTRLPQHFSSQRLLPHLSVLKSYCP